jgi:hypothetical protein
LVATAVAIACSGDRSESKPVALLAASPQAAAAFDAIRDAWRESDRAPSQALREKIEQFIAHFPSDELVGLARVALALVCMREHDFAAADAQLARTASLPEGTAHELWIVARARRLRLGGNADAAMALLRPLVGKAVDPLGRLVFQEELALAALATRLDYEAISYMDAWLRATTEDDKPDTLRRVAAIVEQLAPEVLIGVLKAIRARRASSGYGIDMERILSERLVRVASASEDADLARILLDADSGAIALLGDAGSALSELAASRRGLNVVAGRTVGLLLPTESPGLRDESADVLRGVTWALGLPYGVRTVAGPQAVQGATRQLAQECESPEPAPELQEPTPSEGVRLVTRDDAGNPDRTESSLDELAGEGAAIVIAALDGQTASQALRWGQQHSVPLVALARPLAGEQPESFGFVLGEPRANVLDALVATAPLLASTTVAPVVDASEVATYPPQGGSVQGLLFAPPVSCDIPSVRAGDPRFPVSQWERDRIGTWLVSGSPVCAADLSTELRAAHARGVVALTLEAAAQPSRGGGVRVVSARAGVVPVGAPHDPRANELDRFYATFGAVRWWTALGRDAATLARLAVRQLPSDEATTAPAVIERRTRARDLLAAVRTRLWTTGASGWAEDRTMRRRVCALDSK